MWRGGETCVRSKKGNPNRNSDVRCGRSHKFPTVKGVVCEEQEKYMDGGVGLPTARKTGGTSDYTEKISILFPFTLNGI